MAQVQVGSRYSSLEEAKKAIHEWVHSRGESYRVWKSKPNMWIIVCRDKEKGCQFRIRVNNNRGQAVISILQFHTCPANSHSGWKGRNSVRLLASNAQYIAAVQNDTAIKPRDMIGNKGLVPGDSASYIALWRAKQKILKDVLGIDNHSSGSRRGRPKRNLKNPAQNKKGPKHNEKDRSEEINETIVMDGGNSTSEEVLERDAACGNGLVIDPQIIG